MRREDIRKRRRKVIKKSTIYIAPAERKIIVELKRLFDEKYNMNTPEGTLIKSMMRAYITKLLKRIEEVGFDKALEEAADELREHVSRKSITRYSKKWDELTQSVERPGP